MPRTIRILAALAALLPWWVAALAAVPTASAETTARAATPLYAAPSWDAAAIATLPAGAELVIDGPPSGSFLPVTSGGLTGWVLADAVAADKTAELPASGSTSAAAQDASLPTAPSPDPAATPVPPNPEPPPPTATPATNVPATAAPAIPAPAGTPAAAPAAVPAATPMATTAETPTLPPPATSEGAPPSASPAADPAAGQNPPAAPEQPTAMPSPNPTAQRLVEGPATVSGDANLREWPGRDAPVVFLVPAGSLVTLQGETRSGYVSAEFMWMYGWIAEDLLQPAAPPAAESVPADAEPEDVRTPRAGSGVAFTTVDLALRAGPSAAEPAIGEVPAGTRVELTGVMQNDFQRVVHGDKIGWIANEFLQLPAAPTPAADGRGNGGKDDGRGGADRPQYTERQIVRIIHAAADRYGQNRADMLRVARCESNLDPYAVNPSGSYGLFQFIRSTWESTPYGDEDIFDPQANANAAGWMWQQGRKSEWVCK